MNTKHRISITRKNLGAVAMLAIFYVIFFGGNLPSVNAKDTAASSENYEIGKQAPLSTTTHCGTVSSNETWSSGGNVHVIGCDVMVTSGVTLTIEQGSIVKFELGTSLIVQGSLRVLGTSTSRVYLTSIKDDSVGGDTNNDGSSTPYPGDWLRIEFGDSSNDASSLIDYAVIRYGGYHDIFYSDVYGGITLLSASPTIQNSILSLNQSYAIRADLTSHPTLSNNTYINNGINGLAIQGGAVSNNTTWNVTNTAYFLIDDITVGVGATLTVNPGVAVKFEDGASLFVYGALRSLGTSGNPVYFTSKRDDAVKGDTNNNGASTPYPGDWSHIEFEDSSNDATSLINYTTIRYGGYYWDSEYGGITLLSASPTIQNSILTLNEFYAIRADLTSHPTLSNNTYINNGINGLAIQGGAISNDTTWNGTSIAYFLIDDVTIGVGATLTVNPGVVVKFEDGTSLFVYGALRSLGVSGNPVYFTSKRDDGVKGDTNNDGASTPYPGDWSRIEFEDSSNDASSLINYTVVRYGGNYDLWTGNEFGGITLLNASPSIRNSTIIKNEYYGIRANDSDPVLGCNNIYSNGSHGLYNETIGIEVNAPLQWWGSASGPYHPTTNPIGTGNKVSDGVIYKPFKNYPCGTVIKVLTSQSQSANDGWILESAENGNVGKAMNSSATTLRLGDDAARKQYRSILSFNTGPSLPDTAVITKVMLKVKQQGIVGSGNPVTAFQGFMLDMRKGTFGTSALQVTDWQANANITYGPFTPTLIGGWYTFNIISAKAYINKLATGSGLTQIRLRFKLDDNTNAIANYLSLYSGNAGAASRPQLIIEYYVP